MSMIDGYELDELYDTLAQGVLLIQRSVNVVSHGKPTLGEAQAWLERAEKAVPKHHMELALQQRSKETKKDGN